MWTKGAELMSAVLFIAYYYKKTKDKIVVWIVSYLTYFVCSVILFRKLFPAIPFVSPTLEYMTWLFIVGIPFLALIVAIAMIYEKRRTEKVQSPQESFDILFTLSKDNLVFWACIVVINVIAFLLEDNTK